MESLAIALIGLALVLMIQAHSMATRDSLREMDRTMARIAKSLDQVNAVIQRIISADVYSYRRDDDVEG